MENRIDIHNYKGRLERSIARITKSDDISKENKDTILKFKDYCLSEGIGAAKIDRYLGDAKKYTLMLKKNLKNAKKEDVRRILADLGQTNLSEETKKCFKVMLKKLYKFIRGVEEKGKYPEEVNWFTLTIHENHRKLPEELLTDEEIFKIVQNCKNLRDKAFISSLAESGCRISEIGTMQIKHVSFEEYGARLTVNGKTGMRKILIINSAPYLRDWINQHPKNEDPNSPLWLGTNNEVLCYTRLADILKTAARKAGIKKRVHPHLLRHSRATSLASLMSDASMKHYFGWTQGSKMASVYIHMSGKETDEVILRANGIEIKKESPKPILQSVKCVRCATINEVTNRFCQKCGLILDQKEASQAIQEDSEKNKFEDMMKKVLQNKEILDLLVKKISEIEN